MADFIDNIVDNAVDVNELERGTVIDVRQGIQQSFQDLGIL